MNDAVDPATLAWAAKFSNVPAAAPGQAQGGASPSAPSDDYKAGYHEGDGGSDPNPGPRTDAAVADYNLGYADGKAAMIARRNEPAQPNASPVEAGPTAPTPAPTPDQTAAPTPPSTPDPGEGDSLTPSTKWSIQTVASLSGGAGVTVGGIACILRDMSPNGLAHHISFMGVGFGAGGKIGGKALPFTISIPSTTEFTTEIPVTIGDFSCGGRVMTADLGFGAIGMGVARGQFSAFKTAPAWLDLGGHELGVGASMNIWVGKWTAPKP